MSIASNQIRLADYVFSFLADSGIQTVFLVTGGGAMHLNDAVGRSRLRWVACHHEQACAMAADSYFRLTGRMACVNVTSGPGGTNALTGVFGAFTDSLAQIVLSGQVRYDTTVASTGLPLRQLGDQEADIVAMATPITKYAVMVTEPASIRYHLEKAMFLALDRRPGPVWIDIPMDVQGALIEPASLIGFDPQELAEQPIPGDATPSLAVLAAETIQRLSEAKRPVILAGTGVRLADAWNEFRELIEALQIPVVTAFNAHDSVPDSEPLFVGRPGTVGDRPGNFVVQNADFLLVIGCRLNIRQIGYNYKSWARAAYKVIVDVDRCELEKPTIKPDLAIPFDAKAFLLSLLSLLAQRRHGPIGVHEQWLHWCQDRKRRYPVVLDSYHGSDKPINPYVLVQSIFAHAPDDAIVVTGNGTACVATFQAAHIREGQRLYGSSGSAPMGYDLPAAVGAAIATQECRETERRIICLTGDGSIMMNLQELATISHHNLPVTIILFNNGGYHSIRQTQSTYFPDNFVGASKQSGLSFPDFGLIAQAFRIQYAFVDSLTNLDWVLRDALASRAPILVEVVLDQEQPFSPKAASKRLPNGKIVSTPLEDMAPFLSADELASNMLIPLWPEF